MDDERYDLKTGYNAEDNATCCEDCGNCGGLEGDYDDCAVGCHPGPYGGWTSGKCADWKPR